LCTPGPWALGRAGAGAYYQINTAVAPGARRYLGLEGNGKNGNGSRSRKDVDRDDVKMSVTGASSRARENIEDTQTETETGLSFFYKKKRGRTAATHDLRHQISISKNSWALEARGASRFQLPGPTTDSLSE
jgi:hypothetical protein